MNISEVENKVDYELKKIADSSRKAFEGTAKVGRHSKLTPEVQEKICSALILGISVEGACNFAGISKVIYYDWKKKGEIAKGNKNIFKQFLNATRKAEGIFETRILLDLENATKVSPQLLVQVRMWQASKRFPSRYGVVISQTDSESQNAGPNSMAESIRQAEAEVISYHNSMAIPVESKEVTTPPQTNGDSTGNGTGHPST